MTFTFKVRAGNCIGRPYGQPRVVVGAVFIDVNNIDEFANIDSQEDLIYQMLADCAHDIEMRLKRVYPEESSKQREPVSRETARRALTQLETDPNVK
jgi:hypothetical protein